ncbi:MAG: M67 family metallopeptidase [Chloroflexi bacterium]|nr:M67 family metallopeptidase [Chloroflexota bacterium]MYD16324.1 M67 family metallopeptidase [Chloroflexota bacterium]MYH07938.1 M67 family metallopeptidase [Rhodothermaceae bacterium]MYJ02699.1 M67 family metallopeptidase [Chloroflexota bacterium]
MSKLELPQVLVDEMVAHAREDLPNECCGVIGRAADGSLTLWRATNDEASPWRFNIPPQQVMHMDRAIDEGDWLVIYHSHVASEARPSPTDLRIARLHKGAAEWPYWVLVSLAEEPPSVRAWRIDEGDDADSVTPKEIDLLISDDSAERKRLDMTEVDGRPRVLETPL